MNCYNSERYLREAIDSVYAQTYDNWEIIFWDNASTDGSLDIAKSYDKKLRYYRGDSTISLGAARNKALEQVRGGYIAFLDCDDIWMPEKVEKQLKSFADSKVGLVYSDAIYTNQLTKDFRLYSKKRYSVGKCFSKLLADYYLCMPTVMIRRSVLEGEARAFDPRFELIEEVDLFLRIAYHWELAIVNEPLVRYRVHAESGTWSKGYLVAEEMEYLLGKYEDLYPGFSKQYDSESRAIRKYHHIVKAYYYLRTGDRRMARECASRYATKSLRASLIYLSSLLPVRVVKYLNTLYVRRKYGCAI
jgi:glycosyltransferase involved in cell wall biosynthesis